MGLRSRGWKTVVVFSACLPVYFFLLAVHFLTQLNDFRMIPFTKKSQPAIAESRTRFLRRQCMPGTSADWPPPHRDYYFLYHMHVHRATKTAICVVPKAGYVFWTQLFRYTDKNVTLERLDSFNESDVRYILENYRKVFLAREPSERLWSAYKDKFVYPKWKFRDLYGEKIYEANSLNYSTCEHVTFSHFINFIIKSPNYGTYLDEHWGLYNRICRPCDVDYTHIGKMEHFNQDFTAAKSLLEIGSLKQRSTSTERLVYQLTSAEAEPEYDVLPCNTPGLYQQLLWTSLQYTGHIARDATVPPSLCKGMDNGNFTSIEKCKRSFLDYVLGSLSSDDREVSVLVKNRHGVAIAKAYTDLSDTQRCAILKIYSTDYKLFGYEIPRYLTCRAAGRVFNNVTSAAR